MTRVRVQRVGLGLLGLCAGYQLLMGVYFVLLRPPLLPEDERAIGMTLGEAERNLPGLTVWLDRVFTVLGGQAIAVGLLAGFVVWIIARVRFSKLALSVLAGSGFFSVVLMSSVNFLLRSDFRWALVAPAGAWLLGIVALSLSHHGSEQPPIERTFF